jgi:HPt (histidine-containing phosphotransfer) domain-containing protein
MLTLMDLRESFRGPFLEMAWQRHGRIAELVSRGEMAEIRSAASELHCLSGEASMLDFGDVADIARHAEEAARTGDHARLVKLVTDLRAAIKVVEGEGNAKVEESKR